MRTSNPVFSDKVFARYEGMVYEDRMTIKGTIDKCFLMLILAVAAAAMTWNFGAARAPEAVMPFVLGGAIAGFALALITIFVPSVCPITSLLYSVAEGVFLGALSLLIETRYPGIAFQAVTITFGILLAMLVIYRSGIIKVTSKFATGLMIATAGVALVYIAAIVMRVFGAEMPFLHDAGPIGIGVSVVILAIASLNFLLDFETIKQGVSAGFPKAGEWMAAFGLMVTLFWVYFEVLRLLEKIRR